MAAKKKSSPDTYTKPELRESIKKKVTAGKKGGNPGQWSARKAQLVTQEYEKAGGDYKKPQNESQKSLKKWGDEKWTTADGEKARRGSSTTTRYLPKDAWKKLSPAEKKATNQKKEEGSRKGKQFVSNTTPAAKARKAVTKKKAAPVKKAIPVKSKAATKKSSPAR